MESIAPISRFDEEHDETTVLWIGWRFPCEPEDLSGYIQRGRWDLVFNALCFLAGTTEEGCA